MDKIQLGPKHGAPASEDPDWDVETVIEQVSQDLQGEVDRSFILQVLLKIMPRLKSLKWPPAQTSIRLMGCASAMTRMIPMTDMTAHSGGLTALTTLKTSAKLNAMKKNMKKDRLNMTATFQASRPD